MMWTKKGRIEGCTINYKQLGVVLCCWRLELTLSGKKDGEVTVVSYCCSTQVAPRRNARKLVAKGLFPDATVVRGHDWEWDNQDGKNRIEQVYKPVMIINYYLNAV